LQQLFLLSLVWCDHVLCAGCGRRKDSSHGCTLRTFPENMVDFDTAGMSAGRSKHSWQHTSVPWMLGVLNLGCHNLC
jgi:hypothetical protein